MGRLNEERQQRLEPQRMEHAKKKIEALGYEVEVNGNTSLSFQYKGHKIAFFPYSGWHSGKTIVDGRGLDNLLKQITQQ